MGIGNYTNLSEIMNSMLEAGHGVSISDMVREAGNQKANPCIGRGTRRPGGP